MDGDDNLQGAPLSEGAIISQHNKMSSKGEPTKQSLSTTETSQQPATRNSTTSLTSQHISTLQHLDKQHKHLLNVEKSLQKYLEELQKEEHALRDALVQSSSSLKEQRERDTKKKEEEALARLEEALMNDDDSDDSTK
jgi:predicted RNase H-like nuclease (RuvC/YqgF family)